MNKRFLQILSLSAFALISLAEAGSARRVPCTSCDTDFTNCQKRNTAPLGINTLTRENCEQQLEHCQKVCEFNLEDAYSKCVNRQGCEAFLYPKARQACEAGDCKAACHAIDGKVGGQPGRFTCIRR